MARGDAQADIKDLTSWNPLPVTAAVMTRAWTVEDRFGLHFWDALIVASAHRAGCQHLLTEDLQDGQEFDGVRVLNPFVHEPRSLLTGP